MAIHAPITGAPARAILLPTADTPLGRILAQFDRPKLEAAIEVMIGLLDVAEPDSDMEDSETADGMVNGDGVYIGESDPTTDDFDDSERDNDEADFAWRERINQSADAGRERAGMWHNHFAGVGEDAEDDDPAEDDLEDMCEAGDDGCGRFAWGGMNGKLEAWGSEYDDAYNEEASQPPMTAYVMANDA